MICDTVMIHEKEHKENTVTEHERIRVYALRDLKDFIASLKANHATLINRLSDDMHELAMDLQGSDIPAWTKRVIRGWEDATYK